MIYGHDKTIHNTKHLNIEVDEETGEVVAVWFRCMPLPFEAKFVDRQRSTEMEHMYLDSSCDAVKKILAVEVENESLS